MSWSKRMQENTDLFVWIVQACATVVVLLLAMAVTLQAQPPQGNREKGQAPEACYDSQVANGTVIYTRSAGPRETTFIFLVSGLGTLRFAPCHECVTCCNAVV